MGTASLPLNEMQLEILQLFNRDMSEEDMLAIKRLIVRYFAQKTISEANKVWDENNWSDEYAAQLSKLHERTKYKN
ncbi:MAG: hypothetical protein RL757_1322 [Bacteroidota bacterium]|jgi:hypothetical protein